MRRRTRLLLLTLAIAAAGRVEACEIAFTPRYQAPPGRVAGLAITIEHGAIAAAPSVPTGWQMTITNAGSWKSSVNAQAEVGAAFLPTGQLPTLFRLLPEPGHRCADFRRPGAVTLVLRVYQDDVIREVVVPASALRITE